MKDLDPLKMENLIRNIGTNVPDCLQKYFKNVKWLKNVIKKLYKNYLSRYTYPYASRLNTFSLSSIFSVFSVFS